MDRPRHGRLVAMLVAVAISRVVGAESGVSLAPVRERAVSSRVADLLTAAAPKYSPSVPSAADSSANADTTSAAPERVVAAERPTPANGIVRLPDYVVRDRKPSPLPEPEEVMSRPRLEKIAMQRFLGDETGLDRALSTVTPVHLWRLIPVLGKFPFIGFETNEQRAMRMYEDARFRERMENLSSLLSPQLKPDAPAPPKK